MRPLPPPISAAKKIVQGPQQQSELLDAVLRWIWGAEGNLTTLLPGSGVSSPPSGGSTINNYTISGAGGGAVARNVDGLAVGEFCQIVDGKAYRANNGASSSTIRLATHCVGSIAGVNVVAFTSWASGPVQVYGDVGSDSDGFIGWLGRNGRATLTSPVPSVDNSVIAQVLFTLLSSVKTGIQPARLHIDSGKDRV